MVEMPASRCLWPDTHVTPHSISSKVEYTIVDLILCEQHISMATKTQEHSNPAAYQRSLKELPPPATTIDHEKYDVVIIGAGPAGLFSGSALARFGWNVLVVDNGRDQQTPGRAGVTNSESR